jgi:hypothetical protein
MDDPSEVADILREILTTGLHRIRALAWSGDAKRCGIEADHIPNLPHLVAHGGREELADYWAVERASSINQTDAKPLAVWEPLWRRLAVHVEALAASATMP